LRAALCVARMRPTLSVEVSASATRATEGFGMQAAYRPVKLKLWLTNARTGQGGLTMRTQGACPLLGSCV
jgi:hypothetical protein